MKLPNWKSRESAFTDVLTDKLRKKTGSTTANFGDITKEAFGWNKILSKNSGKDEILPKLILDQTHLTDFMSADNRIKQWRICAWVFFSIRFPAHLFVNSTKMKNADLSCILDFSIRFSDKRKSTKNIEIWRKITEEDLSHLLRQNQLVDSTLACKSYMYSSGSFPSSIHSLSFRSFVDGMFFDNV